MPTVAPRRVPLDPRYYQIAVLSGLFLYGLLLLDFEIRLPQAVALLATVLVAQWGFTRAFRPMDRFDWRSPMISGLSLCLLLRTNHLSLAVLAAVLTIGSKFVLRWKGSHVFNPTNFGVVSLMWLTGGKVWISSGQWGSVAWAAFLMAGLGSLVVHRSERSDVTWALLLSWAAIVFGRALYLGQPWSTPWHMVQSGSLLLFAFHMISDPKTTPHSRAGRIVFAMLVAAAAGTWQFLLFHNHGLVQALVVFSPIVPVLNHILPGRRYEWRRPASKEDSIMNFKPIAATLASLALLVALSPGSARAFCGFYVARADASMYNESSQVVLVRDGNHTVLTMANDYSGDPKEFAVVIPVPEVPLRENIRVVRPGVLEHLDAFSGARLVEYYDGDPCAVARERLEMNFQASGVFDAPAAKAMRKDARGVTIEAAYTVGEYDILILSATQSHGLEDWLKENGYKIPRGAHRVLGSYIRQGLKFFVAKVNIKEQQRAGFSRLRSLQVEYDSPRFMLPIRLGMVNARGPQDLTIYALTRRGRVETTNYRTVKLPTGPEIPLYVKSRFQDFYRDMFARQVDREDREAVFLEYFWDMSSCDPCASDPLNSDELATLGVDRNPGERAGSRMIRSQEYRPIFISRLHVRYDRNHFPEDLVFQETGDQQFYQARYVMRHPWRGELTCEAGESYRRMLRERERKEAETLAELTGWDYGEVRQQQRRMGWLERGLRGNWFGSR